MVTRTTARRTDANRRRPQQLTTSDLGDTKILEIASEAILVAERDTMRFRFVNAAACDLLGYTKGELCALTVPDIHPSEDLAWIREDFAERSVRGGQSHSIPVRRKDGAIRLVDISASVVQVDGTPCLVGFFTDVTESRRLEAHDRQLANAVGQTSDSVVITDADGTIQYANPAFERLSGWSREEAVGQNPRILKSGRHSDAFYRAFWRRLTRGDVWRGTLVNRRKDGRLYEVQATISPLRSAGTITGFVGVERDVTAVRSAESALAAEFRERSRAAAALGRLQPAETVEATAAQICDELLALPGFDVATIFDFAGPSRAIPLAHGGPDGTPIIAGQPIPEARARYLYERASLGPWAEAWRVRPQDGYYGADMRAVGLKAAAYAPIRNGDGLLGLVAAGTTDEVFGEHLIAHLPVVGEFAATSSALLSGWLETEHRAEVVRMRVERTLAERAFHPVFQPIIDLAAGMPVGYEALTRFEDGQAPDRFFASAHSVGLGPDLEIACLTAALAAAEHLPGSCWVSVNLSPTVLQQPRRLRSILRRSTRAVVLELTEHLEIEDYAAVRRRVESLGPTIRLAVDDAGSGFASMRHVVELRPQFLKIDISLVRGVRRDPTRQAMVAGLVRFADQAGCQVIAEGIEGRADLDALRGLGVPFGQGFLLGRPSTVTRTP